MTAQIIDGKTAARELRDRLAEKLRNGRSSPIWRSFWSGTIRLVSFMTAINKKRRWKWG